MLIFIIKHQKLWHQEITAFYAFYRHQGDHPGVRWSKNLIAIRLHLAQLFQLQIPNLKLIISRILDSQLFCVDELLCKLQPWCYKFFCGKYEILISTIYILHVVISVFRHDFLEFQPLISLFLQCLVEGAIQYRCCCSSHTRTHWFININSDNKCSTHTFDLCFVVADQIRKKLMQEEAKKVGSCFDFWFPTNMLSSIVQLPHLHVITVRNDHASISWDQYIYQTLHAKFPCLYRDYKS